MITLREAQYSDHVSIARLHTESWRCTYRGIYSDNFLETEVEENRLQVWREKLHSPLHNQQAIVATESGNIVAFACLYIDDDLLFGSYLDNLHVSPLKQGSGIGKRLLNECAKRILEKAASSKMYLWVYKENEKAKMVYEHLGGLNFETVIKQTEDGLMAAVCRYTWNDVSVFIR